VIRPTTPSVWKHPTGDMLNRLPRGEQIDDNLNSWSGLDKQRRRSPRVGHQQVRHQRFLEFPSRRRHGVARRRQLLSCTDARNYRNGIASMIRILDNNEDLMARFEEHRHERRARPSIQSRRFRTQCMLRDRLCLLRWRMFRARASNHVTHEITSNYMPQGILKRRY
jgi:hypothetical protein